MGGLCPARVALQGFAVEATEKQIQRLIKDPRVDYVEEDEMSYIDATQTGVTWGIDRVDQRDRPLNGSYIYDYTASNVRVYVIDSGIRASHSDFGGRVLSGYTAISDGRGTSDCNGHGTHVAGTVGGATWGVAKAARLVPVRVFGCTGGSSNSTIIAGINWVASNHVKPAVANMSLGGGASQATDDAVQRMTNAGVTVVVAAGNNNASACNYSPARAANALTVGSTTNTDARSSFSNYGSCVNIFGPGSSIRSAWYTSNTATNTISGTSMASPHVAGAVAAMEGQRVVARQVAQQRAHAVGVGGLPPRRGEQRVHVGQRVGPEAPPQSLLVNQVESVALLVSSRVVFLNNEAFYSFYPSNFLYLNTMK